MTVLLGVGEEWVDESSRFASPGPGMHPLTMTLRYGIVDPKRWPARFMVPASDGGPEEPLRAAVSCCAAFPRAFRGRDEVWLVLAGGPRVSADLVAIKKAAKRVGIP